MSAADVRAALGQLSCSAVSDAADRLGVVCQCPGIMPVDRTFRLVGQAWTLRYGPVGQEAGSVGDYIDDLGGGQVVVLDNAGRTDATVWGDLLTLVAHSRGVEGTVIDGVCRDVDRSLSLGYPVFSRGNWMRTGKDRVRVEQTQSPVSVGGIRVEPGDWVLGDADGVVVLPQRRAAEVTETALEIQRVEDRIRAAVAGGQRLTDARRENGYHTLQRAR